MLLLGLTGSIATGKSTVSRILSSPPYSLPIIDADIIARDVVLPGTPAYAKIVRHFSSTTPDLLLPTTSASSPNPNPNSDSPSPNNHNNKEGGGAPLNRPALGRRVFGSSPARQRDRATLNSIVHPAIRRAIYAQLLRHYIRGEWAVVLDVPLLFESGLDVLCGMVVVVGMRDAEGQIRRLRSRDAHLSRAEARDRVASQGDVREKARRCEERGEGWGVVVWNDEGKEELRREVDRLVREMRRVSPRWWGVLLWCCPVLAGGVGLWCLCRVWWANRLWRRKRRMEQQEEERVKEKVKAKEEEETEEEEEEEEKAKEEEEEEKVEAAKAKL